MDTSKLYINGKNNNFHRVCRLLGRILSTVCPESKMESQINHKWDYLVRFTTPNLVQELEAETPEQVIELAADFIESVLMDPTILEEESVNVAQ